jgi:hypothetical protein
LAAVDSGVAALVGAASGALAGGAVPFLHGRAADRRASKAEKRSKVEQKRQPARDACEFALSVVLRLRRGTRADRGGEGTTYAKIDLRGPDDAVKIVKEQPDSGRGASEGNLLALTGVTESHSTSLENGRCWRSGVCRIASP